MSTACTEAIPFPLRVEWTTDPATLQSVEEEWRKLETRVQSRTAFSTYDFLSTWYAHYAGAYGGSPLIGSAWRGSKLLGVAPMTLRRGSIGRIPVTRVDFAPNDSPVGALLVEDEDKETVDALVTSLVQLHKFDVACLVGFAPTSTQLNIVRDAVDGCGFRIETEDHAYALADVRDGYEKYRSSLSGHFRRNLNQKARKIEATGSRVEGVVLGNGKEHTEAYIARMIGITEKSYKLQGQRLPDMHRNYLYELGRRFGPRGMLSLTILSIGGEDAAYFFGLVERGCFYDINLAYAQEFEKLSPGAHLTQKSLELLAAAGVHTVISHGAHEYKKHWATRFVPQETAFLFSPSPRAAATRFVRFGLAPAISRLASAWKQSAA